MQDLQSFQAPSGQGLVFSPVDYARNPGAITAVNSARDSISDIKAELAHSHQEAEEAKAKFEKEAAKASVEEQKYQAYVQKQSGSCRLLNFWVFLKQCLCVCCSGSEVKESAL